MKIISSLRVSRHKDSFYTAVSIHTALWTCLYNLTSQCKPALVHKYCYYDYLNSFELNLSALETAFVVIPHFSPNIKSVEALRVSATWGSNTTCVTTHPHSGWLLCEAFSSWRRVLCCSTGLICRKQNCRKRYILLCHFTNEICTAIDTQCTVVSVE